MRVFATEFIDHRGLIFKRNKSWRIADVVNFDLSESYLRKDIKAVIITSKQTTINYLFRETTTSENLAYSSTFFPKFEIRALKTTLKRGHFESYTSALVNENRTCPNVDDFIRFLKKKVFGNFSLEGRESWPVKRVGRTTCPVERNNASCKDQWKTVKKKKIIRFSRNRRIFRSGPKISKKK